MRWSRGNLIVFMLWRKPNVDNKVNSLIPIKRQPGDYNGSWTLLNSKILPIGFFLFSIPFSVSVAVLCTLQESCPLMPYYFSLFHLYTINKNNFNLTCCKKRWFIFEKNIFNDINLDIHFNPPALYTTLLPF